MAACQSSSCGDAARHGSQELACGASHMPAAATHAVLHPHCYGPGKLSQRLLRRESVCQSSQLALKQPDNQAAGQIQCSVHHQCCSVVPVSCWLLLWTACSIPSAAGQAGCLGNSLHREALVCQHSTPGYTPRLAGLNWSSQPEQQQWGCSAAFSSTAGLWCWPPASCCCGRCAASPLLLPRLAGWAVAVQRA